jgi:hypothetical protein
MPLPRREVGRKRERGYARAQSAGAPVYGYDLATGKVKWKVRAPGTSAQAGVGAFNGGFAVLDRSGGMVCH